MKKTSSILSAAAIAITLATPALAAPVGISRSYAPPQPDQNTIAELQEASQTAKRDALTGNKNNLEFHRKSYEIDQLIERIQSGQRVDPAELDKAMEPTHIW
jgi:hypothetical protein